jgi:hypothetical protein
VDDDFRKQAYYLRSDDYAQFFRSALCASGLLVLGVILQNDFAFGSVCFLLWLLELSLARQPAAVCVIFVQQFVFYLCADKLQECTDELEERLLPGRSKGTQEPTKLFYDTKHEKKESKHIVYADFLVYVFTDTVELVFAMFYLGFFENRTTLLICSAVPAFLEHGRMAFMYDADAMYAGIKHVNGLNRFILLCIFTTLAIHALEMAAKGGSDWVREITDYDSDTTDLGELAKRDKKLADDRVEFWQPLHVFVDKHGDKLRDSVVIASVSWRLLASIVACLKQFIANMQGFDADKYVDTAKQWTCLFQVRSTLSLQSHGAKIFEYSMCFLLFQYLPDAYVCAIVLYTIIMGVIFANQVNQFGKNMPKYLGNADASPVECTNAVNASTAQEQQNSAIVNFGIYSLICLAETISLNSIPLACALFFILMKDTTANAAVLAMLGLPLFGTVLLFEIFGSMEEPDTCGVAVNMAERPTIVRFVPEACAEWVRRNCPGREDGRGRSNTKVSGAAGRQKSPGAPNSDFKTLLSQLKTAIGGLGTIPAHEEYFLGEHCEWQDVSFSASNTSMRVPCVRQTKNGTDDTRQWTLVGRFSAWQQMLLFQIAMAKFGLITGGSQKKATHRSVMLSKVNGNDRLTKAVDAMPKGSFKDEVSVRTLEVQEQIKQLEEWTTTHVFAMFFTTLGGNPPCFVHARELYAMCVWPLDSEPNMPIVPHANIVTMLLALRDMVVKEAEDAANAAAAADDP